MGLGSAVALTVDRVVGPVEDLHAHATRWLTLAGPAGHAVRDLHLAAAGVVHASVRGVAGVAGAIVDATPAGTASPAADVVTAAVRGLWGDDLGPYERRLGVEAGLRVVDVDDRPPGRRLAILVHGFAQDDRAWSAAPGRPSLATTLADLDATDVALATFNTGLPVRRSGRDLADAVERHLAGRDASEVTSVVLVGYSMGGLVARHAVAAGRRADHAWPALVDDVVTVASPFRGSPLARGVHVLASALAVAPQTRPFARFLDRRSAGAKDLERAIPVDDDPRAVHAEHHAIAGVVTRDVDGPLARLLGDLLVQPHSATRPPERPAASTTVLPRTTHLALLHHPTVLARTVEVVQRRPAGRSGRTPPP